MWLIWAIFSHNMVSRWIVEGRSNWAMANSCHCASSSGFVGASGLLSQVHQGLRHYCCFSHTVASEKCICMDRENITLVWYFEEGNDIYPDTCLAKLLWTLRGRMWRIGSGVRCCPSSTWPANRILQSCLSTTTSQAPILRKKVIWARKRAIRH